MGAEDDFLKPERCHALVLELIEGTAGLDRTALVDVADENKVSALGACMGEQRLGVPGAQHGGLVDHPDIDTVFAVGDSAGGAELLATVTCPVPTP